MADKSPRVSAKVKIAIDALVADKVRTITHAAEHAGLSREHLSRELSKPHVAEHMRQKVLRKLSVATAHAGSTKIALLDCDNAMVRDRASSFILGIAGISPETAPAAPAHGQLPGLQIVIVSNGHQRIVADVAQPAHIEHQTALIEQK